MHNTSRPWSLGFASLTTLSIIFACATTVLAQPLPFSTLAGYAGEGSSDGSGSAARFSLPGGVTADAAGNLYVADSANNTIRKISTSGSVTTLAGLAGVSGTNDGTGNSARFSQPVGIAVDGAGNVYVADSGNNTIRKITTNGVVSTLAGMAGVSGTNDGFGTNALFNQPQGLAVDSSTNLYVADYGNDTIRKISPAGVVSTLAGLAGNFGKANGTGTNAQFYQPQGVAVDGSGNVYVADTANNAIRKITSAGSVSTLAGQAGNFGSTNGTGTNALFYQPQGIAVDGSGNVYVVDTFNNTIRQVTSAGVVSTLAGLAANWGSSDGTNSGARFWGPQSVAVGGGSTTLFVADTQNGTIRRLTFSGGGWVATTLAGSASEGSVDGPAGSARFGWPQGVTADTSGNLYVADTANCTIRKLAGGLVSTYAGEAGNAGSTNDTGLNAQFNGAQGIAADNLGNLYVADTANHTIRKIAAGGVVTTLAGSAGISGSADGANALFDQPQGLAVDPSGNVYVADTGNGTIREVSPGGVVVTLAGLAGSPGSADGTNASAHFNWPVGVALDHSGNVYVCDSLNHTIRGLSPVGTNWVVSTLAGQAGVWGNADGTNGGAQFFLPRGLAVDGSGNVLVADAGNQTIRKLTPVGTNWAVTTVGGVAGLNGATDGVGNVALFNYPGGLTIDASNHLYVADSGNDAIRSDVAVIIPSLQYAALPGQFVVIWPLASDGFELEVTSLLGPAAAWTPVVGTPAVSGTNYVLTNATTATAFYRLHKR